jgi:hypothetical protein
MKLFEIHKEKDAWHDLDEISVLMPDEDISRLGLSIVQEGIWIDSGYKDWKYRVDPENPEIHQQRHIHIAKSRHLASKNMQVSWNADGTRHDNKSFNQTIANYERVRDIVKKVLKIDHNVTLENYRDSASKNIMTGDISYSSDGKVAYISFHMI